jgi:Ca-activated chloride channel family protein
MHFAIDYTATSILLSALLIVGLLKVFLFSHVSRSSLTPSLAFSRLSDLKFSSWRSRLASLPAKLNLAALICLMIAFIDPHFLFPKSPLAHKQTLPLHTEGIAICLVLDQSGSMAESVEATGENGQIEMIPKIDLLKRVTKQFILDHPSDLIGLVSFARVPRVLVPLTLDQETLIKQLDQIQVVKNPAEDGTAMGYAIYKTAAILSATRYFANDLQQEGRPPYTIKSAIIIVVTDGFQNPSRLDQGNRLRTMELDDAAAYAKNQNIRLYVVNIDSALSTAQYAPQRRQLQAITTSTGGQFYLVSDTQDLQDIYATIDRLEKGTISQEAQALDHKSAYLRFSLYPLFISLGLGGLFFAFILDSIILRRIP